MIALPLIHFHPHLITIGANINLAPGDISSQGVTRQRNMRVYKHIERPAMNDDAVIAFQIPVETLRPC